MESTTTDSMCRCCAAEGIFKDIKTSYHWMGEEEVYGDMLRECFDVKLAAVEEGGICEVCITQLRNAANFKKQVLHTEKKFKRHLENRRFKPTEVKEEVSGDNGNSSDDNDRGVDSEDDEDYVPEFEIPIKTESPEETKSRKRAAKATTSRAKKSRSADAEDKSVIFKHHEPVKTEVNESLDETLVKIEEASNAVDETTKIKARRRQAKSKQSCKPDETTIQRIQIKPPTERPPTIKGVKIKPPTDRAPPKGVPIKPPQERPSTIIGVPIKPPTKRSPPVQKIKIAPPSFNYPVKLELDKQRYNVQTILQCSNATPIRTHYVGSGYVCCFCKANFLKAADLKTHTIQDHDDETKKKFMHGSQLFKLIVKLDITSLNCNICSMATDTLEQLTDHLNTAHQKGLHTDIKSHIACFKLDGEVMKCHICSVEYQSFKLLQEHMNKHYRNFICDVCGAGFINRRQLFSHSYAHRVGAYKCDTCDKIYNSSYKLKSHMRHTHTGILLHKCHQCDERFKTKISKKNHIKEAHGVVFAYLQCEACDRSFKNHAGLRIHVKRDHLMERRYVCEICDYRFFTARLLKEHEVTHTGSRDFKCDVCSKTYSRKYALKEHMRSHTGDRRFKCTYCDMAFLQKCSLKGHLRSRHDADLE